MSLVPSLLQAILKVDGEALVMHAGEKPYVVAPSGQIELASRGLTLEAMDGIIGQLLPVELQRVLDEFGAVQYELPSAPEFPREHFTVVAARGGDDLWTEIRRRRVPDEDQIPDTFFPPRTTASVAPAASVAQSPQPTAAPTFAREERVAASAPAVSHPVAMPQPVATPQPVVAARLEAVAHSSIEAPVARVETAVPPGSARHQDLVYQEPLSRDAAMPAHDARANKGSDDDLTLPDADQLFGRQLDFVPDQIVDDFGDGDDFAIDLDATALPAVDPPSAAASAVGAAMPALEAPPAAETSMPQVFNRVEPVAEIAPTVLEATAPFVSAEPHHIAQVQAPIAHEEHSRPAEAEPREITQPIAVEANEPVADIAQPVVELYEPIAERPQPVAVEAHEPVAEMQPVVEAYEPIAELPPVAVGAYEPVAELPQLIEVETHEAIADVPEPVAVEAHEPVAEVPEPVAVEAYEPVAELPQPVEVETHEPIADVPEPVAIEAHEPVAEVPEPVAVEAYEPVAEIPQPVAVEAHEPVADVPEPVAVEAYEPVAEIPQPVAVEAHEPVADVPEPVAIQAHEPIAEVPEAVAVEAYETVAEVPQLVAAEIHEPVAEVPESVAIEAYEPIAELREPVAVETHEPIAEIPQAVAVETQAPIAEFTQPVIIEAMQPFEVEELVAKAQEPTFSVPSTVAEDAGPVADEHPLVVQPADPFAEVPAPTDADEPYTIAEVEQIAAISEESLGELPPTVSLDESWQAVDVERLVTDVPEPVAEMAAPPLADESEPIAASEPFAAISHEAVEETWAPVAAEEQAPSLEVERLVAQAPEPIAEVSQPVLAEEWQPLDIERPVAEIPPVAAFVPPSFAPELSTSKADIAALDSWPSIAAISGPPASVQEPEAPPIPTDVTVPSPYAVADAPHAIDELRSAVVADEHAAEEAAAEEAELASPADELPPVPESATRAPWPVAVPPPPAVVLPIARNPIRSTDQYPPAVVDPTMSGLDRLLRVSAARGASTLYLSTDAQPSVRVDGEVQLIDGEPVLSARDVESLLLTLMPERSHEALRTGAATEWICDIEAVGRVRCLSFRDHRGPGGVFRLMPTRSASIDQLALPRSVQALTIEPEGLVLVAGPRSSGKRTLLSAFVDQINKSRRDHVITIEREINIVHEHGSSIISQREVRGDDDEMLAAARAALREDPDVLVIEDVRTASLMNVALEAAAAGRLVVGGFSAHTAAAAVDRIIDLYPPDQRGQVQLALADTLRGVVVQVLLRKQSGGRVPAREVLLNTPAVSSVIAEGKTSQLTMAIEGGRRYGMVPINDALLGLVQGGIVDPREAYRRSTDRPGFLAALKRNGLDTSFVERLG